jgi:hypothetical protein
MNNNLRKKERNSKTQKTLSSTTNLQDKTTMIYLMEKVVSAELMPEFTEAV